MLKVRITMFDDIFPENSPECEIDVYEEIFYMAVETWSYDELVDMYYSPDNRIGMEIIG